MIYFVVPRDQDFGILDYMETWGRNLVGLLSVLHGVGAWLGAEGRPPVPRQEDHSTR